MAERKVAWKPRSENTLIGKRHSRIDGIEKASGSAKFSSDINTEGTLYAKVLTCNHAHAKIASLDVEPARKIEGVRAVHIFRDAGQEIRWEGTLVAAVAADRPDIASDAIRVIEVTYEVLEHFVDEEDLKEAERLDKKNVEELTASFPAEIQKALKIPEDKRDEKTKEKLAPFEAKIKAVGPTKDLGDQTKGDVAAALKNAKTDGAVHKGYYGIHTISHMCLESHGSHCEWEGDAKLNVHLSTQNVSGTGGQFAGSLGLDAADVAITSDYTGGAFGSKFAADEWGIACARLAKEAGAPVRLMLDRATELKIAGTRPSGFAEVTIAADADGTITVWDSHHWGTSGTGGGTLRLSQYPYVFDFDNRNRKATGIMTNCGPNRAWRAPPHPQLCAITDPAIDDIADKLGMDSYDVFLKNLDKTPRPELYEDEMEVAAELMDWKKKWHPRGKRAGRGPVKRGLGMALHQWGGRAHAATCTLKVHSDGTVESFGGSQD
ncbi:MAG: xanthine dehydrogenase family protein molybdopterin-binding subunit, partial [Planctomycetes bacterium]|nr:xanthine dehydrogenase family protein molybdopterin-binding subunit [Planctomycetota bacterium]